jgi:hypothetical protein
MFDDADRRGIVPSVSNGADGLSALNPEMLAALATRSRPGRLPRHGAVAAPVDD